MMSSGQKGANALNIFKWKWRSESSLTRGLLNDVPPEIELSDYQRQLSSGSESPSGFLDGESLNVEPIADLDLFFERLYNYYCEKGLWCIVIKWIVELLSLGFTICFSGFFLLFVDWNGLRNAKCGIDAVESGIKPCDLAKEALHQHPLTPFTFSKGIIVGYLGIFSIYWIFCFLRFFAQLKDTLVIRRFYYNSLHVTDSEVQTTPWPSILEKVVQIQRSQQLCVVKDLSAHDVVMRIMRKENYLIGMLNKGVLGFPISQWVPGAGPAVNSGTNGRKGHLILTKTLEWTLNWCILQSMFDRNFRVRGEFISNPSSLKKRLMAVGLGMLLLSPFLVIFMVVYLFLRHAEQFYNHPSTASSRRWSNLSKWIFREFNEVDHLFKHRINSSVVHAADYLKQFPSPIVSIIAKFISFVSGGFAAILIIIAFLEESLLEGHFILEQLCNMICPSKPESGYLLVLNKAHTQEEFIRGSMTKNPYSSAEIGPLMRDVKNKICHQLDLLGLLEDDYGMELLVAGNIIFLDLSIAQVYELVWKKSNNQSANTIANSAFLLSSSAFTPVRDCLPMTVTYKLQHLRDDELKSNQEELDSVLNLLMSIAAKSEKIEGPCYFSVVLVCFLGLQDMLSQWTP